MMPSRLDISDNVLTSQLQVYFNNNIVQSHTNFNSANNKQDLNYDNLFDCSVSFNNKIQNHKPINETNCECCVRSYPLKYPLLPSTTTNENLDSNFSYLHNLATQMQARSNDISYRCGQCKQYFKEEFDFINHLRKHAGQSQINTHLIQNQSEQISKNRYVQNSSKSQVRIPVVQNSLEQVKVRTQNSGSSVSTTTTHKTRFPCHICNTTFSRKSNLHTHIKNHTSQQNKQKRDVMNIKSDFEEETKIIKPFRCEMCGVSYTRRTNLNAHQKIHTTGRPQSFTCHICNASYSRQTNLNSHMKSHTSGKMSYKCNFCSTSYSRKTNLNIHLRTHTGERPFKCTECVECFTRRSDLKSHFKIYHSTTVQKMETQTLQSQAQLQPSQIQHQPLSIQSTLQTQQPIYQQTIANNNYNDIFAKRGAFNNYNLFRHNSHHTQVS